MFTKAQLLYLFNNGVIQNDTSAENLLNLMGIYYIPDSDGKYKLIIKEKDEKLPF